VDIYRLKEALAAGRVVISRHSLNEAATDDLVLGEIYDSVVQSGEVIEDYPNAYPTPAYLVLGFNTIGDPLHSASFSLELRSGEADCETYHGLPS
jgi:hypothetical protein